MKKVLLFSVFLLVGLFFSQWLPAEMSVESFGSLSHVSKTLMFICLSFIMINVGREFELDKSRWRDYAKDYFIAMATAAVPWLLIAVYYMWLLPSFMMNDWDAWKENLLLSRFAAPTSAGILFTMLAAAGLKKEWIYKKTQTLAVFDDLDTILLMIPLQIFMIGLKWQMMVVVCVVCLLVWFGWKKLNVYSISQKWYSIIFYSIVIVAMTECLYYISVSSMGKDGAIHIEVLLPAFVLGMVMKTVHVNKKTDIVITDFISYFFMILVGFSTPRFIGIDLSEMVNGATSVLASQPMPSWNILALHVLIVTLLSNIGKMFPIFFYRERDIRERLALSIGMFTRGEVGAGIIVIALGYHLGGPALIISVLSLVLNLILTGGFVVIVKNIARSVYGERE